MKQKARTLIQKQMILTTTKKLLFFTFVLIGAMLITMNSCKKDDISPSTLIDIDGNVYKTVKIGNQLWMAENLRTTRYDDGTSIPTGHSASQWMSLTTGAYSVYPHSLIEDINTEAEVLQTYGALYNWYAVETGKLCPPGWRVPADEEMKVLEGTADSAYEVGHSIWDTEQWRGTDVGLKLKTQSGWEYNGNGSDDFGFSAIPAGLRLLSIDIENFQLVGYYCYFWTSTEEDSNHAWSRRIYFGHGGIARRFHDKRIGYSVRCLRDN